MKLLVTGGAGFIGSNFIHFWIEHHPNDEIRNLDKLTYAGNLDNLADIHSQKYAFTKGDICDTDCVKEVMQGIDAVVHFAAESHVDRSITGPAEFVVTNVLGTQTLLDAALHAGVQRFHHISTDEVFGALPLESKERFNEMTPYNPRSPYAASKAASDHLVRAYHETFGLPITISNCSNNYGPYQHPEKLIPLAITNLLQGKQIPVYGDGLYVRDWLHVTDHCRAIETALYFGTAGETYCVGGEGGDVANIDVARKLLALLGKPKSRIDYVKDRPGHDRKYAVDPSKLMRLGWSPKMKFDEGLRSTVDWYGNHCEWWKKLKK